MPAEAQSDAPLSVDSATALLDASEAPETEAEEVVEATPDTELPAAPEAEAAPDPEEAIEDAPEEIDPAPEAPAIEAPRSWDAAERDEFAKLPPAAQEIILAREAERDSRVSKAIQEANDAKKGVEGERAKIQTLADELAAFLPDAVKTFETKWGKAPDWTKVVEDYGSEEAFKLKVQYDDERAKLGELARNEARAAELAHVAYVEREREVLAKISPDLSHPTSGPQLRTEVAQYAIKSGAVTDQEINKVSAAQLVIAHKAMLYDKLQANLKAPKPLAPVTAARPAVRPTAAAPTPPPQRAAVEAKNRFVQTNSIDDAVALLNARS